MQDLLRRCYADIQEIVTSFCSDPETVEKTEQVARMLADIFQSGGKGMICGNGGSMCDAMHFAEEWTGRFRKDREPMPVIALGDPSHLTCVANDFGFESVFSRLIQALGHSGDLLIAISTSGNSENIIQAVNTAKLRCMTVCGMLGKDGGRLKSECDQYIIAPGKTSDRIQEIHMLVFHILIEAIEERMFIN